MIHSPEPWRITEKWRVLDVNGQDLEYCCADGFDRADIERIVACVNALCGVPEHVLRRADCPQNLLHALADYLGMEVQPKTQEEEDRASW